MKKKEKNWNIPDQQLKSIKDFNSIDHLNQKIINEIDKIKEIGQEVNKKTLIYETSNGMFRPRTG